MDAELDRNGSAATVMRTGSPLERWFHPQVFVALLIFVLFYFFKLADFYPAIDDEYAVFRPTPIVWVAQGRWAAYLFEKFILPRSTIPFFPLFLFGVFLTAAYFVLLSAHRVRRANALHLAAFPLFCAFPTWVFMAAFSSNIAASGLAMLLACAAVYFFRRAMDESKRGQPLRSRLLPLLVCIALGAVATGIYQTFLIALAVIGLGAILTDALQNRVTPRALVVNAAVLGVAVCGSLAVHTAAQRVAMAILGLKRTQFVDDIANTLSVRSVLSMPMESIGHALKFIGLVYGGDETVYGVPAPAFPVLLCCGMIAVASARKLRNSTKALLIAIAIAVLCLPFALYVLSGWDFPIRTLVAVPPVVWLFAVLGLTSGRRWLELATSIALVVSLFHILHSASLIEVPAVFVREHDRALAAEIYRRIVDVHPEFDRTKTYLVDFYGGKPFQSSFKRPASSTLGYSFFEWDGGSMGRMLGYMQLLGYRNLTAADKDRREADLQVFKEMPVWPAAGSVKVVGEVTLVKLGPDPGWPFNAR